MEKKNIKLPNYVKEKNVMKVINASQYALILGAWSNGKSYATKNGIVRECVKRGVKFGYLRRFGKELGDEKNENYFLDCNVSDITGGEWSNIVVFRHKIYLARFNNDTSKWERGQQLGECFALNEYIEYKSRVFLDYEYLIFEEFITLDNYLDKEPYKLFRMASTLFRNKRGHVALIGNTVSPICPYYREWELVNTTKQKPNTIDTYKKEVEEDDGSKTEILIKVYMTPPLDKSSGMFFGHLGEITGGTYHVDNQPHIETEIELLEVIYTVVFRKNDITFLMQFVHDKKLNSDYWYIQPKVSKPQKNTRLVGEFDTMALYHTDGFTGLTTVEQKLFNFLKIGKYCFSDNLTGTLWKKCYKEV